MFTKGGSCCYAECSIHAEIILGQQPIEREREHVGLLKFETGKTSLIAAFSSATKSAQCRHAQNQTQKQLLKGTAVQDNTLLLSLDETFQPSCHAKQDVRGPTGVFRKKWGGA